MTSQFEELLEALGKVFRLALHVDHMNACSIQVREGLVIQLQPDMAQENLWLFSKITEVPPGKFRENVLREALKANGMRDPVTGVLGFWAPTGELALCQKYPLNVLNGERLSGFLGAFLDMANSWQKAIESGQSAPPQSLR